MKRILLIIFAIVIGPMAYSLASFSIIPVVGFPVTAAQNATVSNIQYTIENLDDITRTVGFANLTGQGISYTTTCANLNAQQTCSLYLTFMTPSLPTGQSSIPYTHYFNITGGSAKQGYLLTSTIVTGGSNLHIVPTIALNTSATATGPFDLVLTNTSTSTVYDFPSLPFGTSTPSTTIPSGDYSVVITPSTVTGNDSNTYNSPTIPTTHIPSDNTPISLIYTENATTAVSTNITAPDLVGTIAVSLSNSSNTYNNNQAAGVHQLAPSVVNGVYTLAAPNYVGSDSNTYTATLNNPYTIDASHNIIPIVYNTVVPPGPDYNWHLNRLPTTIKNTNVFAIWWGGGSTTAPVHISTNPPLNPWLNTQIQTYESGTPTPVATTAVVQNFPSYIAMGSVVDVDSDSTTQLGTQLLDGTFHYEGTGDAEDGFWDQGSVPLSAPTSVSGGTITWSSAPTNYSSITNDSSISQGNAFGIVTSIGAAPTYSITVSPYVGTFTTTAPINANVGAGYTPIVDGLAAQAAAAKLVNSHNIVAGNVIYTIKYSDGPSLVEADTKDDALITANLYNFMWDAWRMQYQYTLGHPMVLMLNPDSTSVFQNCGQWSCPISWKTGITQDAATYLVAVPNLQADLFAALARMQSQGYMTSGTVTSLEASLTSSGILTPPFPGGRGNTPGLPEMDLVNTWIMKNIAPNVSFGLGNNVYDNNNALLNNGNPAGWETGSVTWIHKVNHMGMSSGDVTSAIDFEGAKFNSFLNDMYFTGKSDGSYKPDFLFVDIFEFDPMPGYPWTVGFLFNGVDWDTYMQYVQAANTKNIPIMLWQMPGSSLQVQGNTFTGVKAGTITDYVFGDTTLDNDFDNIATALDLPALTFTSQMNQYVYYTTDSKVNNVIDYMRLTSSSS